MIGATVESYPGPEEQDMRERGQGPQEMHARIMLANGQQRGPETEHVRNEQQAVGHSWMGKWGQCLHSPGDDGAEEQQGGWREVDTSGHMRRYRWAVSHTHLCARWALHGATYTLGAQYMRIHLECTGLN